MRSLSLGKIQDDTVGIGERISPDTTAIHIFFRYVSEDPAGDVFRSGLRERRRKFGKVFLRIFQALHREAKVIKTLSHAHIRMVRRSPYKKIYGAVGYAERIFIAKIFPFLETENLMVEFGHLFGFRSPDGDMVDLPWLLPAVVFVTFLNFGMFFPRDVELRSRRVVTPEYGKRHLLQPLGDKSLRVFLLHSIQNALDIVDLEAEVI